ncbi:hypothetical protein WJX82_007295 [Trebouxia sp. C0006]
MSLETFPKRCPGTRLQDLEGAGVGSRNNIQHRVAELIPAGGQLMAQLVCHPILLQVLHRYLGSKCRLATFSSNTLLPQDSDNIGKDGSLGSGLGWHPDYPYHDIDQPWPPPEFPLGCQVLICLDEFRQDNGGTMFMPNSHIQKPEGIEDDMEGTFPGSMTLTAPAGSVLVAHSAWWHRQTKNVSKLPRTALLGNYTPGHVVPKDNMEKQCHDFKASESIPKGCCASIVPDKMINARLLTACNSAHQSYLAGTGKPYTFHKVNGTGVFAFPGTRAQDPNDWMTDAEWATAPLEGSGLFQVSACKVHSGFLKRFESIASSSTYTHDLREALETCEYVLFTGHSLGGALASLAAISCKSRNA